MTWCVGLQTQGATKIIVINAQTTLCKCVILAYVCYHLRALDSSRTSSGCFCWYGRQQAKFPGRVARLGRWKVSTAEFASWFTATKAVGTVVGTQGDTPFLLAESYSLWLGASWKQVYQAAQVSQVIFQDTQLSRRLDGVHTNSHTPTCVCTHTHILIHTHTLVKDKSFPSPHNDRNVIQLNKY